MLPALLAFAHRLDLAAAARAGAREGGGPGGGEGRRQRRALAAAAAGYFALTIGGYAVGLGLASRPTVRVTVNGVEGQPALLYLVPCTLGAIVAPAARGGSAPCGRARRSPTRGRGVGRRRRLEGAEYESTRC